MKAIVLSLLLLVSSSSLLAQSFTAPPDVPAVDPNPEFPLHMHVFRVHWNHVRGIYEGYGRADLLGDQPTGLDYTFSCSEPFLHNAQPTEFYQARWKKQDQKLEILMQKVGSDHLQKCELKVALKPMPYGNYGAAAAGATPGTTNSPTP
jgi:hypothetical protein